MTPEQLHSRLGRASKRLRRSRFLQWLCAGAALAAAVLLVALLADAWWHFGSWGRWMAFGLTVTPLVAGLVLAVWHGRTTLTSEAMARRIESESPELGARNALINAVQFDLELADRQTLRNAVFAEVQDPFRGVNWGAVFQWEALRRLGIGLACAGGLLALWATASPNHFSNSAARIFLPASDIAPLTRTRIQDVTPGRNARVVHEGEFKVQAKLAGTVPFQAWVHFREPGADWQQAPMHFERTETETRIDFSWVRLVQPMEWFIEAGDARTPGWQVEIRPRTVVRKQSAEIEPPAYTRRGMERRANGSPLTGILPGSRVSLEMEFSAGVKELSAADERNATLTTTRLSNNVWRVECGTLSGNKTATLQLTDVDDYHDAVSIPLGTEPDAVPVITISQPEEGRLLTADRASVLPLRFKITDNYGLAKAGIFRTDEHSQDGELVEDFPAAAGSVNLEMTAGIPLAKFATEGADRITFVIVATDANNLTGPGRAVSRPLVVNLASAGDLTRLAQQAREDFQSGLKKLIEGQTANLKETSHARQRNRVEGTAPGFSQAAVSPLLARQAALGESAARLAALGEKMAGLLASELKCLVQNEMQGAILALRNGVSATTLEERGKFLDQAAALETQILARLLGAPDRMTAEADDAKIRDLLAGVGDLLKQQRILTKETDAAMEAALVALAARQDRLADQSLKVREQLERDSKDASAGDAKFREHLSRAWVMMNDLKVYEDMLTAAEEIDNRKQSDGLRMQHRVENSLVQVLKLLNEWQFAEAKELAQEARDDLKTLSENLTKLEQMQQEIVEKSREMARRAEFRPEDAAAADQIAQQREAMKQMLEKMLTDMHALPDLNPSNELKSELVSIFEDVIQADREAVEREEKKPTEIAVQKEESLLTALDEAQKRAEEMEHWLPSTAEAEKWLLENFDKSELPQIPNIPLQEQMEDLVGDLLKEQETMDQEVQDAASNQALQQNVNGWDVRDGPMPGFGNNGKSGNERPNDNEMTGRSSGGREGKSNGEMVGNDTKDLEGRETEVRRTNDPMQQGKVGDNSQISDAKATGGGKAGGFSNGVAMDGEAPRRQAAAPSRETTDAAAAAQAMLAEKTARTATQAKLLYLPSQGVNEVAKLMDESARALKAGRLSEYGSLHRKIVAKLKSIQDGMGSGEVVSMPNADAVRQQEKQLLGGYEGEAPDAYTDRVADYYKALTDEP